MANFNVANRFRKLTYSIAMPKERYDGKNDFALPKRGGSNFAFDDVKNMLSELHLSDDALSQIEMFLETQANVAFDEIIQSKLRLPHKELRERLTKYVESLGAAIKELGELSSFPSEFDRQFKEINDDLLKTYDKNLRWDTDEAIVWERYRRHTQFALDAGERMLSLVDKHPAKKGRKKTTSSRDALLVKLEDKLREFSPSITASRAHILAANLMGRFGSKSLYVDTTADTTTTRKASKRAREIKT